MKSPATLSRLLLMSGHRGFTLIELLLVIGIIATLASIVIVAINPTKQLADARNAQRKADVNTILNAVYQFTIDKSGLPTTNVNGGITLPTTETEICRTKLRATGLKPDCTGKYDAWYLTGSYIVAMPIEPSTLNSTTNTTGNGYSIQLTANRRIRVQVLSSIAAENGVTISAER